MTNEDAATYNRTMILGVDEVGRGPWAGPLVVGAVVLPDKVHIEGLTDSKKVPTMKRVALAEEIQAVARGWGLGWVQADELDRIGLGAALRLATVRAVEAVHVSYQEIIIDGTVNFLADTAEGPYVVTMKKADLLIPAVSAASILAKVARDAYMVEQSAFYPEYGFAQHVGYGTLRHREAIERHGVTPLHRLSFAPLRQYQTVSVPSSTHRPVPTSKQKGDIAEDNVAAYLLMCGHNIIERNWRTKRCEIDIISEYEGTIYFTEVKFRRGRAQGGGVAAVTEAKQARMKFAANYYLKSKQLHVQARLACAAVVGSSIDWFELGA